MKFREIAAVSYWERKQILWGFILNQNILD